MVKQKEMVRLGIVGCGDISHVHGNAVDQIDDARFVACCDLNATRAMQWSEQYGCDRYFTDYNEMIAEMNLDGIVLATWPNLHLQQIKDCVAGGVKNILCQKSLALTGAEAMEIWDVVEKNEVFLMEGFMYRHHPAIKKLETILAQNEIGPIDNVRAVFSDFDSEEEDAADPNRNWRQRKECGGGIPYDFACYAVNACGHFSNSLPLRVYATGGKSQKYDIVNRLYGVVEYDNGCVGIIESSKKSSFSEELQISCTKGILNLPISWTIYEDVTITQTFREEWANVFHNWYEIPQADSYLLEMINFVNVIKGEEKPVMPLRETLVNIFVIEALVQSVLTNKIVEIKLPEKLISYFNGI
jgi:predicted dehydrogenase